MVNFVLVLVSQAGPNGIFRSNFGFSMVYGILREWTAGREVETGVGREEKVNKANGMSAKGP